MSNQTPSDGDGSGELTRAFRTMPRWKATAMVLSLVVGVLGAGSYVAAHNLRQTHTVTVQQTVPAQPGTTGIPGGNGFVGGGGTGTPDQTPQTVTTTTTPDPNPSLTEKLTPYAAKIGFSFFVGLVAGLISRTFLKIAALLAGLVVAAVAAAHYFNINLDLSGVQAQAGQATTWMQGQLGQLWEAVKNHLPSAGGATAGFLFGMKRR